MGRKLIAKYTIILLFIYGASFQFASAVTDTQSTQQDAQTTEALLAQIQQLTAMVASLQAQITELQGGQAQIKTDIANVREEFKAYLHKGAQNDEVKMLQQMLSSDPEVYPEGIVSGYYGPLTEKAVKRFQEKHGIEGVGVVGPKTRRELNKLFAEKFRERAKKERERRGEIFEVRDGVHINQNIRVSARSSHDVVVNGRRVESRSESRSTSGGSFVMSDGKVLICHKGETIDVDIHALGGHVRHGDMIGECDGSTIGEDKRGHDNDSEKKDKHDDKKDKHDKKGDDEGDNEDDHESDDNEDGNGNNTGVSNINIIRLNVTDITPTDAVVSIETDSDTTATVRYDVAPVSSSSQTLTDATVSTTHEWMLSGLNSDTAYYFDVVAEDMSGNTVSTSSVFLTLTLPDDTAPIISAVSADTATSTATITWTTDEPTIYTVNYDTTPVADFGSSTPFVADMTFTTDHSALLEGLSASTTYQYSIEATDVSGNVSDVDGSFTTL